MKRRLSPGASGWVVVGACVIAAELLDERTMSEAFLEASRHPVYGKIIWGSWVVLTAHLFGAIPKRYDPIHLFWKYSLPKARHHGTRAYVV